MNRSQGYAALASMFVVVAVTVAACGGGDQGNQGSITTPGKDTYQPPTTGATGTGKPAHATDVTCSSANACGNWYCACKDGAIVNSANCTNGYCLDQTVACPDACSWFKHGAWTGDYGGGPKPPSSSSTGGGGTGGSSGNGGTTNSTGSGQQCSTNATPCGACLAKNCCDLSNSCSKTQDCSEYIQCTGNCAHDETCLDGCAQAYPSGADVGRDFYNCGDASCPGECG